jgi:hypothetical protein
VKETRILREVSVINLSDDHADLTVCNFINEHFPIERLYYISNVLPGKSRGLHAHKELEQIFLALSGEFTLSVTDGKVTESVIVKSHGPGFFLPAGYWRELTKFSSNGICLVLASKKYDSTDYISSFDDYKVWKNRNS